MSYLSLKGIDVFLAVAETGGVTRAGEKLGLSRASASHTLQQLEQSLGVTLFW